MKGANNMAYQIQLKVNSDTATNIKTTYFKFIMNDNTTTDTIFTCDTDAECVTKIKELLNDYNLDDIQVISQHDFDITTITIS